LTYYCSTDKTPSNKGTVELYQMTAYETNKLKKIVE